MTKEKVVKMRKEFQILINRCGCSRASLEITKQEAKKMTNEGLGNIKPHYPHCTPKKCFPTLYNFLYPKGGFNKVSYLVENYRRKKPRNKVI